MLKSNNVLQKKCQFRPTFPLSPNFLWRSESPSKVFFLSVGPNEVVRLAGIDVVAATEVDGEKGAYNLTVLVAEGCAADAKRMVYHIAQNCVEFIQHEIYSAKSGDFLIFLCYLCYVIRSFIDL